MPRPPLPPVPPAIRWGSSVGALALIAGAFAVPGKLGVSPRAEPKLVPQVWADVAMVPAGPLSADEKFEKSERQKKPPCTENIEVEYEGFCWMPHASKPPCHPGLIEGKGQCLARVPKAQRPNTSLGH